MSIWCASLSEYTFYYTENVVTKSMLFQLNVGHKDATELVTNIVYDNFQDILVPACVDDIHNVSLTQQACN